MSSNDKPFREWAEAEISRLRAEADALETTLHKYTASVGYPHQNKVDNHQEEISTQIKRRERVFKFDVVENALRAAGSKGLSIPEMYKVIEDNKVGMNRTTLRTMIWHKKNREPSDIIQMENGNYKWVGD